MSISRDTLTTLTSRVVVLAIATVQSIILARYLQPEGRGQLAALMLIPQTVAILAPLGIQWSSVYYLRLKERSTKELLQNGLGFALAAGFLGFAIAALLEYLLYDEMLQGLSLAAILAATFLVPVRTIDQLFRGIFRGSGRIPMVNLMNALRAALLVGMVVAAILLLRTDIPGLALVFLSAESVIIFVAARFIYRGIAPRPRFDSEFIKPLVSYGARIYAFSILLFFNYRIGLALVRYFLDYREVGYFVTSITMAELLWNVPAAFAFVLFPRVAGAGKDQQNQLTTAVCRITVAIVGGACIVAALLVHPAVLLLYGEEFLPAAWPMIALLPGIFTMSVQQVLGADVSGRGYPGRVTIAAGVGVVINIALNVLCIPMWGAVGAALASSVAYTVIAAMVLVSFLQLSNSSLSETVLLRSQDVRGIWARLQVFLRKKA
jgi:O-antigen/teichoic acid export membrane protein